MTQETLISLRDIKKYFEPKAGTSGFFSRRDNRKVKAVDGVNLDIRRREIYALVGESGSGKTTTGMLSVRALVPTSGSILYDGTDLATLRERELRRMRHKIQMIYQDPFDSIDPRFNVFDVVAEGARAHNLASSEKELHAMVAKVLEEVGLTPAETIMKRFPHQLSGGQRQRVAFARAAILHPDFVVADEPVSMLDVSIKAEVLNSMMKLRDDLGISFLLITHDLPWARHVADRIAVMYLGKVVESATADELVSNPLHPYTQALIAATPVPDPRAPAPKAIAAGEIPSAIAVPSGCSFHPRCPLAFDRCRSETPELREKSPGHFVSCHLANG